MRGCHLKWNLAGLTEADFFTVESMCVFKNETFLFRNTWIKIVFLGRSTHCKLWTILMGFLSQMLRKQLPVLQTWLNSPATSQESTRAGVNIWRHKQPTFPLQIHLRHMFRTPALPSFTTAFGRLFSLIFSSLLGLKQFLHCLVDRMESYLLLWGTVLEEPVPSLSWSLNSLADRSWSSFMLSLQ